MERYGVANQTQLWRARATKSRDPSIPQSRDRAVRRETEILLTAKNMRWQAGAPAEFLPIAK